MLGYPYVSWYWLLMPVLDIPIDTRSLVANADATSLDLALGPHGPKCPTPRYPAGPSKDSGIKFDYFKAAQSEHGGFNAPDGDVEEGYSRTPAMGLPGGVGGMSHTGSPDGGKSPLGTAGGGVGISSSIINSSSGAISRNSTGATSNSGSSLNRR